MGDRCLEGLKEMAEGIARSGNTHTVPTLTFDPSFSPVGSTMNNAAERVFNAVWKFEDVVTKTTP